MRAAEFCSHCGMNQFGEAHYVALQQDERFIVLRRKTGRAVLVVTILFMVWYFLYVVAAVFARDAMRHVLIGNVNVALVFGLLQFAVTFLLARRYSRYSREVLDPLRSQLAGDAERPGERTAVPGGER
jgi:uncharacterized membrane protein (DUF485 family)